MILKKTTIYFVLAVLCLNFQLRAQTPIKSLTIGDTVPESFWEFEHSIYANSKITKQSLSNYKGKLLLLDFWASWCGACIASFPKLEIIKNQFPNQLNILKVSYQALEQITRPFENDVKENGKPTYDHTTILNDEILKTIFPYKVLPHFVWINAEGKVAAITSSEQVTIENVKKAISSVDYKMVPKIDQDTRKPLYLSKEFPENNQLLSYSILFKGKNYGLSHGVKENFNNLGILSGKTFTNLPLIELYEYGAIIGLFRKMGEVYSVKRRVIDIEKPELIVKNYNQASSFNDSDYYSYTNWFPETQIARLENLILEDLNIKSGYYGSIEKRVIPCLVITKLNKNDSWVNSTTVKLLDAGIVDDNKRHYKNYPYKNFIGQLNSFEKIDELIIDGTGYNGNVDFILTKDADKETLIKELKVYGLTLQSELVEQNVFVLTNYPKK